MHSESEIFIAAQPKFLRCSAVCIFHTATTAITVLQIFFICMEKHQSRMSLGLLPAGDRSSVKAHFFFFLLTRVLTKLKLMAWLHNPLAMTTFSLFSPSVMLFGRERTAGRLSLPVLMLSCCHAHCMSKSLSNFPLFFCQASLWFSQGRKWSPAPCAAVCVTLPRSRKNKQSGKVREHYRPAERTQPNGEYMACCPKAKITVFLLTGMCFYA